MGFIRLFGVVGKVLVKPHLLRDVNEEFNAFNMEEATVKRKLASDKHNLAGNSGVYRKFFKYIIHTNKM